MMKPIFCVILALTVFSCSERTPDVYQWRGDLRTGVYHETNLLRSWPDDGPPEIWTVEGLGNGYGSPTVTEEEIFITGELDSLAWLFCFDLKGSLLWKVQYGKEWARHYPGSRSAPTVVDDLVYTVSGMGILACMKRENGEIVWTKDYVGDLGGVLPMHGFSEAPVIDGGKVFCTPGGPEINVAALNRYTGELLWSCKGAGEVMGYNQGNIIVLPERTLFITFSAYNLLGVDAGTGELLWIHPQDNVPPDKREPGMGDTHSNNIIFEDGIIYYAAGTGNRGVTLKLSEDGAHIEEIWRTPGLDSYMGGFVKLGDYLYGCGTRKKELKSFDAGTGAVIDSLRLGTGAVIAADNMLYYYSWGGELSLIGCDHGKMQKKSGFKMVKGTKEHFSHPVIRDGVLYQRRGEVLMAFAISG
jgi:outer membrane protein assembly factor BamB